MFSGLSGCVEFVEVEPLKVFRFSGSEFTGILKIYRVGLVISAVLKCV